MDKKTMRLLEIRKILNEQDIGSQDELLKILLSKNFSITQATLSRDLKQLKISKIPDSLKGYIYVLPDTHRSGSKIAEIKFKYDAFLSLEISGNIAVMKTLPGYANIIASSIDSYGLYEILGTVSGDDTIIIALREGTTKNQIIRSLTSAIPEIGERFKQV